MRVYHGSTAAAAAAILAQGVLCTSSRGLTARVGGSFIMHERSAYWTRSREVAEFFARKSAERLARVGIHAEPIIFSVDADVSLFVKAGEFLRTTTVLKPTATESL